MMSLPDTSTPGMARTQETFGAATPGRRVLYSASWVLPAPPPGHHWPAVAQFERYDRRAVRVNPAVPRNIDVLGGLEGSGSAGEDLPAERDGQHRSDAVDLGNRERIVLEGGEVGMHARREGTLLLLLMAHACRADRVQTQRNRP